MLHNYSSVMVNKSFVIAQPAKSQAKVLYEGFLCKYCTCTICILSYDFSISTWMSNAKQSSVTDVITLITLLVLLSSNEQYEVGRRQYILSLHC